MSTETLPKGITISNSDPIPQPQRRLTITVPGGVCDNISTDEHPTRLIHFSLCGRIPDGVDMADWRGVIRGACERLNEARDYLLSLLDEEDTP